MDHQVSGVERFHANIERMREVGRQHDARRAMEAHANTASHLAIMAERGSQARTMRRDRADAGVTRRNEHNARLAAERAQRLAAREALKLRRA